MVDNERAQTRKVSGKFLYPNPVSLAFLNGSGMGEEDVHIYAGVPLKLTLENPI